MLELKSVVAKVLRHYEIELPKNNVEPAVVAELILRPQSGIQLKIKLRTL